MRIEDAEHLRGRLEKILVDLHYIQENYELDRTERTEISNVKSIIGWVSAHIRNRVNADD